MTVVDEPEWPDKILAAALLVTIAGLLGLAYVALRAAGATLGEDVPAALRTVSLAFTGGASAAAVLLGFGAYHYQSSLLVGLGIVAAVLSLGMLGVSSLIGLVALWPLIRSYFEGEETRLDHRVYSARRWPDKAAMASVLLAAGGAVAFVQAVLMFRGDLEPLFLSSATWAWGAVSAVAAVFAFVAARLAFRRAVPIAATTAAWGLVLTAGMYVVGPMLGAGALVYLALAHREDEFTQHATA